MKNFLLLLLFISIITGTQAQSILYDYGQQSHIRLELNKPIFGDDLFGPDGISFLTFGAFLNGHFRVGSKNTLAVELPFSRAGLNFFGTSESDIGIGNIGVAFQLRNNNNSNFFEFGLRLPISSEDNLSAVFGQFADYTERFPAFFPETTTIRVSYMFQSSAGLGGYFRAKPGLSILVPSGEGLDTEALLNVNIAGGYRSSAFDVNGGLTTATILTEEDIDFSDRLISMFFASFTYTSGNFHPGIVLRIPLDEGFETVVGVSLNYTFGGATTIQAEN